jgi:hypothetical protein
MILRHLQSYHLAFAKCVPPTEAGPRGLWLEEVWRCHVVGRDIKKAGLLGQVLGTVPLDKEHLKTLFR